MVPELPETLVHGREAAYFRYFFAIGTVDDVITDAEVEHYVSAYGDLARLHAAFEMYRAIPENAAFNDAHRTPVAIPLLLVGGEQVFGPGMPHLAKLLRAEYGWPDVEAAIVEGGRHYLPEERPDEIAELIERHALR
jgi:pimeloyl-ACP methyl ester carboxylesterase